MGECVSLIAIAAMSACGGAQNGGGDGSEAFAYHGQFKVDGTRFGSDPRSAAEISEETHSMRITVSPAVDTVVPSTVAPPVAPPVAAPAPTAPSGPPPLAAAAPVPTPKTTMTASFPSIDTARIPTGSQGYASEMLAATDEKPSASGDGTGAFRTVCDFSHMAFDDPIVYPGQPGKSHLHVFFGNTGTNANSTATSIATTGNSTCRGGTINRSGYWAPAIIDTRDGTPVTPLSMIIYYKTGYNGVKPGDIRSFPQGLRMIAGDPKNSGPYQWGGPAHYTCLDASGTGPQTQNIPVTCATGNTIWASVMFPQCWDGINLDSPDHKSHMSYPVSGSCPATHPVAVPEITVNVQYAVTDMSALARWRLASDTYDSSIPAGYSSHADWFNGWKPQIMDAFVQNCDQPPKDCHAHLLGNGQKMLGVGA
jgi:hypothetical protein